MVVEVARRERDEVIAILNRTGAGAARDDRRVVHGVQREGDRLFGAGDPGVIVLYVDRHGRVGTRFVPRQEIGYFALSIVYPFQVRSPLWSQVKLPLEVMVGATTVQLATRVIADLPMMIASPSAQVFDP